MKHIPKVLIITNIPSPYRVDFFSYLQHNYPSFNFQILFTKVNEDNRKWDVDLDKITNIEFLNSCVIKYKKSDDFYYLHIPFGLIEKLNSINPDVIVAFEYNLSAFISLQWAKCNNKKYINLTDGTLNSEKNINYIQKLLRKYIISKSDAFIASSSKAKEKLLHYNAPQDKIYISYLSENLNPFLNHEPKVSRDTKTTNILFVGQIIERKGIDLLLKALEGIQQNFVLRLVGGGDDKYISKINELCKSLKLQGRVEIIRFLNRDDLIQEYDWCDLFVFPSRVDCFGLVMLEALAMKKFQIVSKYADGSYDIINDNSGILIDPYDTKMFHKILEEHIKSCKKVKVDNAIINKFKFSNTVIGFMDAINNVMKKEEIK